MWSPLLFSCSTCIHTHRHFKFQFALALFVDTIPYTVLFLSSSFLFFLLFFFFHSIFLDFGISCWTWICHSHHSAVPLSNGKRSSAFLNPQFLVLNPHHPLSTSLRLSFPFSFCVSSSFPLSLLSTSTDKPKELRTKKAK